MVSQLATTTKWTPHYVEKSWSSFMDMNIWTDASKEFETTPIYNLRNGMRPKNLRKRQYMRSLKDVKSRSTRNQEKSDKENIQKTRNWIYPWPSSKKLWRQGETYPSVICSLLFHLQGHIKPIKLRLTKHKKAAILLSLRTAYLVERYRTWIMPVAVVDMPMEFLKDRHLHRGRNASVVLCTHPWKKNIVCKSIKENTKTMGNSIIQKAPQTTLFEKKNSPNHQIVVKSKSKWKVQSSSEKLLTNSVEGSEHEIEDAHLRNQHNGHQNLLEHGRP